MSIIIDVINGIGKVLPLVNRIELKNRYSSASLKQTVSRSWEVFSEHHCKDWTRPRRTARGVESLSEGQRNWRTGVHSPCACACFVVRATAAFAQGCARFSLQVSQPNLPLLRSVSLGSANPPSPDIILVVGPCGRFSMLEIPSPIPSTFDDSPTNKSRRRAHSCHTVKCEDWRDAQRRRYRLAGRLD